MAQQVTIPAPPLLPANWDPNARDIGYDWDYTTETFVNGRFLNVNDPHGRWAYGQSEHPIRLGAPSPGPNWHPILHKWGLQALAAAGFINDPPSASKLPQGRMANLHSDHPVHPVFRKDQWPTLTVLQWNCIVPALEIVSAIIDEPDTLRFFAGCCGRPLPQMWDNHVGYYEKFTIPTHLSDAELRRVWNTTVDMRKYVHFVIEDFDTWMTHAPPGQSWDTTYGMTSQEQDHLGIPLDGAILKQPGVGHYPSWASKITVPANWLKPGIRTHTETGPENPTHLQFLNETLGVSAVNHNRQILIQARPALLRWMYAFATTLLHEFTHAYVAAYYRKSVMYTFEPFCGNDKCNEVGWAMQQHAFGAAIHGQTYSIPPLSIASGMDQTTAAPFGFFADEHWDRFRYDTMGLKRIGKDVDYNETHDTFPVHQSHTQQIFEKDFWTQRVQRFGARELRVQRNDWGVRWKPDPAYAGYLTEHWGDFDRRTNQLAWNVGITPGPGWNNPLNP